MATNDAELGKVLEHLPIPPRYTGLSNEARPNQDGRGKSQSAEEAAMECGTPIQLPANMTRGTGGRASGKTRLRRSDGDDAKDSPHGSRHEKSQEGRLRQDAPGVLSPTTDRIWVRGAHHQQFAGMGSPPVSHLIHRNGIAQKCTRWTPRERMKGQSP